MDGRGTTNILLAIIAGALLFGSSAVVGALQWLFLALAAFVFVCLAAMLVGAVFGSARNAVREVVDLWHGDGPPIEKWAGAMGIVMVPIFIWAGGTMAWFWLQGVEHPSRAATDTYAGWALLAGMSVFGIGVVVIALMRTLRWLREHRGELPARTAHAGLMWIIGIFAIVVFPLREWRYRRAEGSGAVGLVAAPAGMAIVGAAVSLGTVALTAVVIATALVALGVID